MEFTKFTDDLKIIQKLDDKPNQMDGLNADQMKAKFDEAGISIQNYLNNILLVELSKKVAPSGYGLGGVSEPVFIATVGELDNFKANGKFKVIQTSGTPILEGVSFNMIGLEVSMTDASHGTQIVQFTQGWMIRRVCDAGIWGAWEWLNPPMVAGVEYRTAERWNGNPVYTMLVNFGAPPNASQKEYRFSGVISPSEVIAWNGYLNYYGINLPYQDGSIVVLVNTSGIVVNTTKDYSKGSALIAIKYTK